MSEPIYTRVCSAGVQQLSEAKNLRKRRVYKNDYLCQFLWWSSVLRGREEFRGTCCGQSGKTLSSDSPCGRKMMKSFRAAFISYVWKGLAIQKKKTLRNCIDTGHASKTMINDWKFPATEVTIVWIQSKPRSIYTSAISMAVINISLH